MITEDILSRLEGAKRNGSGWVARCPAHEDRNPSLSIKTGNDGRTLLHCHAGCSPEAVCGALNLSLSDLMAERPANDQGKRIAATYPYRDETGKLLFEVVRYEPKDFRQRKPDQTKPEGWNWSTAGVRRVLFRVQNVRRGIKAGQPIYVVEGEKDALALESKDLVATCNSGGAGKWLDAYSESLRGANVIIVSDKDEPGRKHAQKVFESIRGVAASVRIIEVPDVAGRPCKDAADYINAGGDPSALETLKPLPAEGEPKFVDFGPIFDGGLQIERPTVAKLLPDLPLLYAGRINETHSEPGTGKTNVAAAISLVTMREKGTVLFLDPEDNPTGIARRFASFGATKSLFADRFRYVHNPEPADYPELIAWAQREKPALVVLDGVAEALAAEGLDENSAADILLFFRTRIRPFADAGAAVLLSDHVAKSTEGRGRWARGSGAKLGRYDGACLEVKLVTAYSPGVAGSVRLVVAKDRCGGLGPVGTPVVDIHFEPGEEGTDIEFRRPGGVDDFVPTAIMEKVSRHLEVNPDASLRDLRGLGKKSQFVTQAIEKLVEFGHVVVISPGAPKPNQYRLIKPYREGQS